jgi:Txe/YoeB family toxin of Txe-Axe toxin-antitoxin module
LQLEIEDANFRLQRCEEQKEDVLKLVEKMEAEHFKLTMEYNKLKESQKRKDSAYARMRK